MIKIIEFQRSSNVDDMLHNQLQLLANHSLSLVQHSQAFLAFINIITE